MDISQANLILFTNSADTFFPEVQKFVDGKIPYTKILPSDQVVYKRRILISQELEIKLERNCDIIYGIELTGDGEDIDEHISNFDFIIGGNLICKIFLEECYVMENDGKFSIKINFDRIFLNYCFLPIIGLVYHEVKLKINLSTNPEAMQSIDFRCYLVEGLLENDLRKNCVDRHHDILMNHYEKYQFEMNGNKIFINFGYSILSASNFIKSLRFKFLDAIDFNDITIYGNDKPLTTITRSDIEFISNREFILQKFNYNIFLYNKIVIEFDKNIQNNLLTLTTINYNMLIIKSGIGGVKFRGLRRDIGCNISFNVYEKMGEEIYTEKVKPRGDKECAILQEEFEEGEERIICGNCFASFKRSAIEEWFERKMERICPYGRCEKGIWYIWKN